MNPAKAYTYFATAFDLKKVSPKGWYPMNCPFCDHGRGKVKFAVHFAYNLGKCWECEYRERLVKVIMDVEGIDYRQAKTVIDEQDESYMEFDIIHTARSYKKSEVLMPAGYTGLLDGHGVLSDRVRHYLEVERGFDIVRLDMMGFGYCTEHPGEEVLPHERFSRDYFGYLIIPFKRKGILQYYIGRDFIGQEPKYKNPAVDLFGVGKEELFYNEDALDLYDEVFLLEGAFDSECVGPAAFASLGWSLSDTQKRKIFKSDLKRLVMLPDKGFYKTAIKTAMDFLDEKEVVVVNMDNVRPGAVGPNGKELKDVNELGVNPVMEEYSRTPVLTYSMAADILMS